MTEGRKEYVVKWTRAGVRSKDSGVTPLTYTFEAAQKRAEELRGYGFDVIGVFELVKVAEG